MRREKLFTKEEMEALADQKDLASLKVRNA
jgi:hypothetical protein